MQNSQQENRSHTLMHSSASLPTFPAQGTSFLPSLDTRKSSQSLWDLTLVQFLYLDLNKLNIHLLDKVADTISQEDCALAIEISDVPCLQIARNFQEMTAFCNILALKFPETKWPELLTEYDTLKDKDQWSKTLMKGIEKVLELARTSPPHKRTALCILYAFLIDKETAENMRKQSLLITSGVSPARSETRQSRSWSDGHIEISMDKTTQVLANAISELEIKAQNMEIINDPEEEMAKMQMDNENKDQTGRGSSSPEIDTEKVDETFQGRKSLSKHDSLILKKNYSSAQKEARQSLLLQDLGNSQSNDVVTGAQNGAVVAEVEALNQIKTAAAENKTPKVKVGEKIKDFFRGAFYKKTASEPLKVEPHLKPEKSEKSEKIEKTEKIEKPEKAEKSDKIESPAGPVSKEPKDLNVIPLIQNLSDMSIWRDLSTEMPQDQSESDVLMDRDGEDFHEKKRETRDGSRTARSEESIRTSPSHHDLSKLIKKEIPNFSGQIYMKLSGESTWNKYFAKLLNSSLVLYNSSSDAAPVHVIPCFRSTISYIEKPEKDYIEIFHKFDSERVQILMDPNSQGQNDSHDPFKNLRMWYIQLKIITQKAQDLKLPFNNYYPIGKIQLIVSEASQIKGLPNNSTCFIRILHIPYTLKTSQIAASETLKWKQSFFLPLCDNFLAIKLELVSVFHEGWLKDTRKEEVICTKEIRAADILATKLNGTFSVNLDMQYTETKRKLLAKSITAPDGEMIHPKIKLKIKPMSTMHVLFSPAYGDFVEGVHMDRETYVKQHFKLSIRRVKRIVRYIKLFIADFNSIFYYKYPLFSYFCILLFSYTIVVARVENLLANLVFFIVMLSIYKHPKIESQIKPLFTDIFFREDFRNPYYSVPMVKTLEDIATQKDLNTEKWKFKLVDEDNLVTQLLVIKRILTGISIGLTKAAGFCEKLKNIILWKEPARTSLFIFFGVILYCILALLPLRWSLLLIVWLRFAQGFDHYKKLRTRNEEVAKMTINFIVKRSFPAYCQQIWKKPNSTWPTALNFINFQKKMIDQLNFRLGIVLPDDALCDFKSPQELVTALATCSKSLKFKTNQTEKANLAMVRWKDPEFSAKNLLNFIMNAPSDYYRVIHPNVIHPESENPTVEADTPPS